jgi:hypothetical protein
MLAAGGKYTGDNTQIERVCHMIILDLWTVLSPLLTPRWQQAIASLKQLFKRMGVLR